MPAKSWIEFIRIALDILPSIYGCLENQIKIPYSPKNYGPGRIFEQLACKSAFEPATIWL